MHLVYLDEQMASHHGKDFTAVHGVFVEADKLHRIRRGYYEALQDLLDLRQTTNGSRRVGNIPVLHGSDLLPEFSDERKVSAVDLLLESLVAEGGFFFRLGFYHVPLVKRMTKEQRVEFCAIQLQISMKGVFDRPYAIVHEVDKEGLQRAFRFSTDHLSMYYQLGQEMVSINLECLVGHYVASASDLGCQAADLAGYTALKKETARSEFSLSLSELYEKYGHRYFMNKIIEMQNLDDSS